MIRIGSMHILKGVLGYSLFSVEKVLHGAHIRPYELCKELGIQLAYRTGRKPIPLGLLVAIIKKERLLVFPGYTVDPVNLFLMLLAKLRHCRLVLDVADIPYLQYQFFLGQPSQKSMRDFAKLIHLADVLLFSTQSIRLLTMKLFDVADKPNYLVENASDPLHFKFKELPKRRVILFVGGYIPARGVDELIEAFRILRKHGNDCSLRLIGLQYPQSLEEEGIEIIREVYYDRIPSLFTGAYVFVIPHRPNLYMRIAAPLKLFDAMASGLPVVSTPCDETVAVIDREQCGLVSGSEPDSMADAIEHLLENRNEAEAMGQRGRLAVESRWSWRVRANELAKLLMEQ